MELTARDIMDAQVICIQADATLKRRWSFSSRLHFLVSWYSMPPDTWLERWRCWM